MADASAIPTAEDRAQYEALRKELPTALSKKKAVDKQLTRIEARIYALETNYLTETAAHNSGNIIQGFEGYLKNQSGGRKKHEISDHDRIFSNSSFTYQKSLDVEEGNDATTTDDYRQQSVGPTTVVLPPAPKNADSSLSQQQKRARDKEYQRRKRASASLKSTGESEEEISNAGSSRRANKRARVADDD